MGSVQGPHCALPPLTVSSLDGLGRRRQAPASSALVPLRPQGLEPLGGGGWRNGFGDDPLPRRPWRSVGGSAPGSAPGVCRGRTIEGVVAMAPLVIANGSPPRAVVNCPPGLLEVLLASCASLAASHPEPRDSSPLSRPTRHLIPLDHPRVPPAGSPTPTPAPGGGTSVQPTPPCPARGRWAVSDTLFLLGTVDAFSSGAKCEYKFECAGQQWHTSRTKWRSPRINNPPSSIKNPS